MEMIITKETLALIKGAESVAFFHELQSKTWSNDDGIGSMAIWNRSYRDAAGNYISSSCIARLEIPSFVYAYGRHFPGESEKRIQLDTTKAKAYESVYVSNETFKTALENIKVGDKLSLYWTADNNSETLEDAKLHADELYLKVNRTSKAGTTKEFRYLLSYRICFDNSSRMISENRN
jgi:hypothetical protein